MVIPMKINNGLHQKRKKYENFSVGFRNRKQIFLKVLFDDDDDQNEEEPMEEDAPYNDEFNEMESSTDDDDDEEEGADGPKVCLKSFSFFFVYLEFFYSIA